jgi:hypothetical protein
VYISVYLSRCDGRRSLQLRLRKKAVSWAFYSLLCFYTWSDELQILLARQLKALAVMLPVVLLALLASLLEFAGAHDVQPRRFVVHPHKTRGLAPRQEIKLDGAVMNQSSTAETGIIPLTLSSDRRWARSFLFLCCCKATFYVHSSYYMTISAGGIAFRLALDTASSDLFLASSACQTTTCKSVPRYPLSYESPTFVSVNDNSTSFNISFADGTGEIDFP